MTLLLLTLLNLAIAETTTPYAKCLASFAAANQEDRFSTTIETYKKIFEELASDQNPSFFEKMAESKDPFVLPKDSKLSSSTLQDTLKEMETLLQEELKANPKIREALLAELKTLSQEKNQQQQQQQQMDKKVAAMQVVSFEIPYDKQMHKLIPSNEGTYFIEGKGNAIRVYDLKAKKILTPKIDIPITSEITRFDFSQDGKSVLVMTTGDTSLRIWDFDKGMLQNPQTIPLAIKVKTSNGQLVRSSNPDEVLYFQYNHMLRFNLKNKTGEAVKLPTTMVLEALRIEEDPTRPGFFGLLNDQEFFIWNSKFLTRSAPLKRKFKDKQGFNDKLVKDFTFSPDGKDVYFFYDDRIQVWNIETGSEKTLPYPEGVKFKCDYPTPPVIKTPDGKHAIIGLYEKNLTLHITPLNLATGKFLPGKRVEENYAIDLHLSPNGKFLQAGESKDKKLFPIEMIIDEE